MRPTLPFTGIMRRIPCLRVYHRLLDVLLPTSCAYCRSGVGDSDVPFFCAACWADFSVLAGPLCPHCGRPFESPEALTRSRDHCCGSCRTKPPLFDQALSIGHFEGSLREAIHQYKYRPCRSLGFPLARWMARNLEPLHDIDVVMPVPLHSDRLRQRGFNQALLLAHELSTHFSLRLCYDNLMRVRSTRPQVELTGEERVQNVKNAFALVQPREASGKSILLVDDVFTTGATMNECAGVLKRAGAARVNALTLAMAV